MECLTYNVKEAATVIGCSVSKMYEYARNGTIRPCKVDGVKFNKRDVLALINEDVDSLSPYIYKQTQKENEQLKEENSRLRRVIMEISVTTNTALRKGDTSGDI